MDGDRIRSSAARRSPERSFTRVFAALDDQHVRLEGMLLKPNMVMPGKDCAASGQRSRKSLPPHCAACVATCRRQCRASCSCRAARTSGRRRSIWTRSTGCPVPSRGRSVFLTGARCRITRWRHGMAGTRTWRRAGKPCTTAPAATARPVSAGTQTRWRTTPVGIVAPSHRHEWRDD